MPYKYKYCDIFNIYLICQGFQWYFSHLFSLRFMIKRAQGRNRFGMKNFKKRWFRLTNHEFTYHKTKGEIKGFSGFSYSCIVPLSINVIVLACITISRRERICRMYIQPELNLRSTHVVEIKLLSRQYICDASKQAQAKTNTHRQFLVIEYNGK